MMDQLPARDPVSGPPSLLDRLFDQGLLVRTGVDGLYGRSGEFESVVEAVDRIATRLGAGDGAESLRFPPGMSRPAFERSGYLKGSRTSPAPSTASAETTPTMPGYWPASRPAPTGPAARPPARSC